MQTIRFHLDFVSPYAYLAFQRMPEVMVDLSYQVRYRPVLLDALLGHHGHDGLPDIAPKRWWTYRQVQWLAHVEKVPMRMPAVHPFDPLPLLKLAMSCAEEQDGCINRAVSSLLMNHVWNTGGDPNDPAALEVLRDTLKQRRDPAGAEVTAMLHANTDAAIAHGVFDVPAFQVGAKVFWGFHALPMVRACVEGDAWFDGPAWDDARVAANAPLPGG